MPLGRLTLPNIREVFNRPGHGLSDAALSATVRRLFAQGLIDAVVIDPAECGESCTRTPVGLDDGAIDAALRERASPRERGCYRTYYGLTAQGAAVWEAFAQPDWSLFIEASTEEEKRVTTVLCQDERALREFCETYGAWLGVALGDFEFDRVEPWQATYWKGLPFAHRGRCVAASSFAMRLADMGSLQTSLLRAATCLRQRWCNRWL
jgi:hypothetical protein